MTDQNTGERAGGVERPESFDDKAKRINAHVTYANWSVWGLDEALPENPDVRARIIDETVAHVAELSNVTVRGWYDVSAFRADADLLVWTWSEDIDELQLAYHRLSNSPLGDYLSPVWSVIGVHRQAEFNARHVPTFLVDPHPKDYLVVYPFIRSLDWYVLPEDERREMLVEHGRKARDYPDVRANTIQAFALGDYEWILAFEADELHRIVDLMRTLRDTKARLHVREETPFYTGPLVEPHEWADRLAE